VFSLIISLSAYALGLSVWAEYQYRQAKRALERRDLMEAQTRLTSCLQAWPNSAELHLLAARTARRTTAYEDAQRHLNQARRLGGVPEAVELERVLLQAQRGEVDRVQASLLDLVRKDHPDTVLILEALARGSIKSYRLPQALSLLEDWLTREPDNVQALIWLGEVEELVRSNTEAMRHYRRAVEIDTDHEGGRLRLARLLLEMHEPGEALGHFERLRERHPDGTEILFGLARCQLDLGSSEEACGLLDAVLAADPNHADALAERGRLAVDLGRFAEAEEWLRKARARAPGDQRALYALFLCLKQCGKHAEARECRIELDRIEDAKKRLNVLTRQIAQTPHDPVPRYEAGMIFLDNGQDNEGIRWLVSALQEDPRHQPSRQALEAHVNKHRRPKVAEGALAP
jgi:tetratricopeptide (TPR) repeat protein